MESTKLKVLYEDNHLLAVDKPAGLATIGVAEGLPSLAKLAKAYLKVKYQKPGNVYLGIMSRLDAVVSGVVLFARTSKAASRLTEQFREHTVQKTYWAVAEGIVEPPAGTMEDWVAKNEGQQKMEVVKKSSPHSQRALLEYRRIETIEGSSFVEVQLKTGRKHQIRVQFGERSYPLLGDRKYGATRPFPAGIALHSWQLTIMHPTLGQPLTIEAAPPASWKGLLFRGLHLRG